MKCHWFLATVCLATLNVSAQFTGIGTTTPYSRLHVNGTAWFQGDNTALAANAGTGIGIGYPAGASGGYIFAFDYASFTPRNLWLNHPGGSVVIGSTTSSPLARLDVRGNAGGIYVNSTSQSALFALASGAGAPAIEAIAAGGHGLISRSNVGLGVYAVSAAPANGGVLGEGKYIGAQGTATGTDANRQGIRGEVAGGGFAGLFNGGTTAVYGTLTKTAGAFLIDHPLEPATKFLYHSFVESPDMKNIYDGLTTTDANGQAWVTMPPWFSALNMEFRYQLTCIGQFAQAIVQQEISNNQFLIKTDKPHVKVSWQVTGTRNDPYARENRIPVEKAKQPGETGKFIYPQGYGKTNGELLDILRPTNLAGTAIPLPIETPDK